MRARLLSPRECVFWTAAFVLVAALIVAQFGRRDRANGGLTLAPGKVDAVTAFWNAEGVTLHVRGVKTNDFRVDRYGLSRVEWSRFLGGQGQRAFLFWDHGWMGTQLADEGGGDHLEVLNRDGLGFGLELQAAGGLVGIDYGLAPGNAPLEGRIHLQLITTF